MGWERKKSIPLEALCSKYLTIIVFSNLKSKYVTKYNLRLYHFFWYSQCSSLYVYEKRRTVCKTSTTIIMMMIIFPCAHIIISSIYPSTYKYPVMRFDRDSMGKWDQFVNDEGILLSCSWTYDDVHLSMVGGTTFKSLFFTASCSSSGFLDPCENYWAARGNIDTEMYCLPLLLPQI